MHLSEKERWRIVFLSKENGLTPTQISRKVGCSRQAVYDVLDKEQETGTVKDRPRSGRKRKFTTKEEKKIVKKARKVGALQTAREFSVNNPKRVSDMTVRRMMKKHKFFYLNLKKIPMN